MVRLRWVQHCIVRKLNYDYLNTLKQILFYDYFISLPIQVIFFLTKGMVLVSDALRQRCPMLRSSSYED